MDSDSIANIALGIVVLVVVVFVGTCALRHENYEFELDKIKAEKGCK